GGGGGVGVVEGGGGRGGAGGGVIKPRRGVNLIGHLISGEPHLLIFVKRDFRSIAGRFTFAVPDGDHGRVGVRINIEAVVAGFRNCECLVWRIHFVYFVVVQPANV